MIVITAPTSNIGRQVLDSLLAAGEPLRIIARDPARLPDRARDQADIVPGTHGDRAVVDRAFTGADAVFWLAPPAPQAATVEAAYVDFTRPAADAISRTGVRRVVGISALGRGTPAAKNAGLVTASLAMDDLIAATGTGYRALTLPSFMDNWLRQVPSIRDHGTITSLLDPDLAAPTCSTRDIAAVAARLLRTDWTGQQEVPVLGPADLSHNDIARTMSQVLGRPVSYRQLDGAAYVAALTGYGMSAAMARGMLDMMLAKNDGLDNAAPRTPQASTPTTFREWCEDVLAPAVRSQDQLVR
jgi:uncharacterized protein YbjT (DUF2867 family)